MYDFAAKFAEGLPYHEFLKEHGSDEHRRRWQALHERVRLTDAQRALVASFKREMHVLCLAGAWCGDCVNQCPIFEHFEAANPRLAVRYFDRDTHADLAGELKICGGARVPVLVFVSEDGFEVARYGDRTLAKYRKVACRPARSLVPDRSGAAGARPAQRGHPGLARHLRTGGVDSAHQRPAATEARGLISCWLLTRCCTSRLA